MPTVFTDGPYRFFFYSDEGSEPPHIHVRRDDKVVKFWLSPVLLQNNGGFSRSDVREIQTIVKERQEEIIEAWNDFFGQED